VEDSFGLTAEQDEHLKAAIGESQKALAKAMEQDMGGVSKEVTSLGAQFAEMKLSLETSQKALSEAVAELSEAHQTQARALTEHVQSQSSTIAEVEAKLRDDLRKVYDETAQNLSSLNDHQRDKHSQNAEGLSGLQRTLESAQSKLQEDLSALRASVDDSHGSLKDTQSNLEAELLKLRSTVDGSQSGLTDVSQRVDVITQSLEKDNESRTIAETKLDKLSKELRDDLQLSFQDAEASLKVEFERYGKAEDIQGLQIATAGLKSELQQSHSILRGELTSHVKSNEDKHKSVQDALKSLKDEQQKKHAKSAESLEAGLKTKLEGTQAKLQEELRSLKAGGSGSLQDLSRSLTEVTQQVEKLEQVVEKERELRNAVALRVDKASNEQEKTARELRKEIRTALEESRATLTTELAEHARKGDEAQDAFRAECSTAIDSLSDRLDTQAEAHNVKLAELEIKLRNDVMKTASDLDAQQKDLKALTANQAAKEATYDKQIQLLESSTSNTHKDAFQEIQAIQKKIQDVSGLIQGKKSKSEGTQVSLEERISSLENQARESIEVHDTIFGQYRQESMTREKNIASVESRLSQLESLSSEVRDRNASESESAQTKIRDVLGKYDQQRSLFENYKLTMDKRMSSLETNVSEAAEAQSQSLTGFMAEHGKEMTLRLQAERAARETQEKTFLEYIQDARQQKDALESSVEEQLRSERIARDVQLNQVKDQFSSQMNWHGNAEYTDIILQERASREAAERSMEQRIDNLEKSLQGDRSDNQGALQRIWEAFDGHTHEASIVSHSQGPPIARVSPSVSSTPSRVESPKRTARRSQSPQRATRLVHPPSQHVKVSQAQLTPTEATPPPDRFLEGVRASSITRVVAVPTTPSPAGPLTAPMPVMISGGGAVTTVPRMISYPAVSSTAIPSGLSEMDFKVPSRQG